MEIYPQGSNMQTLSKGSESILDPFEEMRIIPDNDDSEIQAEAAMRSDRSLLDHSEILLEISEHAIVLEDLGEFLRKAAGILRESYDYNLVQIWTLSPRQNELLLSIAASRIPNDPMIGKSVSRMVEECRRKGLMLPNENPGKHRGNDISDRIPSRQLTLPVRYRGKLLGLLSVESDRLEEFPPEQSALIEKVAFIIAAAFDRFKTVARAGRSYEYLQAILDSASNLAILSMDSQGYIFTGSSGIESVFQLSLKSILGRDIITLFTDEAFRRELALYMSKGNAAVFSKTRLEQANDKGKLYLDVSFQRMSRIENLPIGFLCLAIDVTANVLLHQKLETLSLTDELTGLFNRRHLTSVLASEIKRSRRFRRVFSLCLFDLDGFKQYNDREGHINGDKALTRIANLMRALTRMNVDTSYRFGGDELAILMPETSAQHAVHAVDKILACLRDDFDGTITASVGIAEFDPALNAESMMELADRAMYQAKASGGDQVVISH
jgi:diguanylate cyclase (GGDEF)-like protein